MYIGKNILVVIAIGIVSQSCAREQRQGYTLVLTKEGRCVAVVVAAPSPVVVVDDEEFRTQEFLDNNGEGMITLLKMVTLSDVCVNQTTFDSALERVAGLLLRRNAETKSNLVINVCAVGGTKRYDGKVIERGYWDKASLYEVLLHIAESTDRDMSVTNGAVMFIERGTQSRTNSVLKRMMKLGLDDAFHSRSRETIR